ncbi:MAG: ATP-binding cassette domain-containing protein [Polyangiaceae bacterium]|nr:ATP-binding cassette domain-containing protein [Polyangiaceae bacterium]
MKDGITLAQATLRYGDLTVLNGIDLEVQRGECLLVGGESGVGKSTFLEVCAGLITTTSGTVTLAGERPDLARPSELFRRGVRRGYVFEGGGLISNLSTLANVALPLRYHADVLDLDPREIDRRARDALARLRVSQADLHALPAHLSFGVRKRVAMARALALEPNFFFCDDPDSGLDASTANLVHDILIELRNDPGVTVVVTTNSRSLLDRMRLRSKELVSGYLMDRHFA